jgi:hypothetical protein
MIRIIDSKSCPALEKMPLASSVSGDEIPSAASRSGATRSNDLLLECP